MSTLAPPAPAAVPSHPAAPSAGGFMAKLNTSWHERAMWGFAVIVLGHWAEHLFQAYQIWVMGMPRPHAMGALGMAYPWLVHSEWLHYGYAIVMLVGLFLLRPGMAGRARTWWNVALAIQFWHHIEHALLLVQANSGWRLAGRPVPTSIIQLWFPRVELHLFYNAIVFFPMVVAMVYHLRPSPAERGEMRCSCALRPALQA
jgi:hypothetical protein